jgi:hypothetical protein
LQRIEFTVETDVPPERVMAAACDFTEKRPDIWENISRRFYKVHDQATGGASAPREVTSRGNERRIAQPTCGRFHVVSYDTTVLLDFLDPSLHQRVGAARR